MIEGPLGFRTVFKLKLLKITLLSNILFQQTKGGTHNERPFFSLSNRIVGGLVSVNCCRTLTMTMHAEEMI